MKKENTKVFDIEEIGFTDLEGQRHLIPFDKGDFANALFNNAQSIDMDDFARAIHKHGKAEVNELVEAELLQLIPTLYKHRVAQAVKDYIEKLK